MTKAKHDQIDTSKLKAFLKTVKGFPLDAGSLLDLAGKAKADNSVIKFLETIDPLTTLASAEDVITRAEEINLLHSQKHEEPEDLPLIEEHEID